MTANAPPRQAQDRPVTWHVQVGSERGAAHVQSGLPNQDAVGAYLLGQHGAVAAVADGHGHHRHFRSARGSRLAVTIGCQAAEEFAVRIDELVGTGQIIADIRDVLVPAVAGRWRAAVAQDLADEPITDAEQVWQAPGDQDVIAYGSTLLLALVWRRWLVLTQIGDGDIVCVRPDGGALLPVPGDPSLDGLQTTSLCEPRAENAFRVAAVDLSRTELAGVMLATDGYGNAQLADPWAAAFSSDLAALLREHDVEWLAGQVPAWAARCASADGSADDTSIALLIAPARNWPEAGAATGPDEVSRAVTEPVILDPADQATGPSAAGAEASAAEQAPSAVRSRATGHGPLRAGPRGMPGGVGRRTAAPRRRSSGANRIALAAAAIVVIAAVVAGLALVLRSPSGKAARPHRCDAAMSPVNGRAVHGTTITACDAATKRQVAISVSGLPRHGATVAIQADGKLFVVAGTGLYWTLIMTAAKVTWHQLAAVTGTGSGSTASDSTPRLCLSNGAVVVDVAPGAGGLTGSGQVSGAAGSWVELRVNPAAQPPTVGTRRREPHPACPVGELQ
jgi:hypothetical protein